MAKKISSHKKKQVIADYAECESMNAVARKHKISPTTVRKILNENVDGFGEKCAAKKMQTEVDILAHMDTQREKVCLIIDKYLEALLDDDKIKGASPNQLTTALGTVIDKFLLTESGKGGEGGRVEIPAVLPLEEPHE